MKERGRSTGAATMFYSSLKGDDHVPIYIGFKIAIVRSPSNLGRWTLVKQKLWDRQ